MSALRRVCTGHSADERQKLASGNEGFHEGAQAMSGAKDESRMKSPRLECRCDVVARPELRGSVFISIKKCNLCKAATDMLELLEAIRDDDDLNLSDHLFNRVSSLVLKLRAR
jgi:hypothetical protein